MNKEIVNGPDEMMNHMITLKGLDYVRKRQPIGLGSRLSLLNQVLSLFIITYNQFEMSNTSTYPDG